MTDCLHWIFLRDWHGNEKDISAHVSGNWRVRCGHCNLSLGGCLGDPGPTTEVIWRHDGKTFFGEFCELVPRCSP